MNRENVVRQLLKIARQLVTDDKKAEWSRGRKVDNRRIILEAASEIASVFDDDKEFAEDAYAKAIKRAKGGFWRSAETAADYGKMAGYRVKRVFGDLRKAGYEDRQIVGFMTKPYGRSMVLKALSSDELNELLLKETRVSGVEPPPLHHSRAPNGQVFLSMTASELLKVAKRIANEFIS